MNSPFPGLAPNLIPNPPGEIPEAPTFGDATPASPFKEAIDVDEVIKNLVLDRPLKLYIPNRDQYPEWEFRIINSIPQEIADAANKGFREVSDERLTGLFNDLVAGTDKTGKAYRPILVARPKKVGQIVRERIRSKLQSLYAGMDPATKQINSAYAELAPREAGTKAKFEGDGWRIRIR